MILFTIIRLSWKFILHRDTGRAWLSTFQLSLIPALCLIWVKWAILFYQMMSVAHIALIDQSNWSTLKGKRLYILWLLGPLKQHPALFTDQQLSFWALEKRDISHISDRYIFLCGHWPLFSVWSLVRQGFLFYPRNHGLQQFPHFYQWECQESCIQWMLCLLLFWSIAR